MRRLITLSAVFVFVLIVTAIETDRTSIMPIKEEAPKPAAVKIMQETNVSFAGVVKEITDTQIVVERTVRNKIETLEFELDRVLEKIRVGDKVKVSYTRKEGKCIAKRVDLVAPKRIITKNSQATTTAKQDTQ